MLKRAAFSLSLIALAACQGANTSAPAVQLYAMDCGVAQFRDVGLFADDGSVSGQSRRLVNPCFLIRHPDGDLIWDTGFPDAVADMESGLELAAMGAHVTMSAKLADQLAQIGLTPADIEFVSFSHQHGDHTGNGSLFAQSTWIVDADERAYMFADEARQSQAFAGYAQLETAETRLIEGDADHDVFGDGSVVIVQTPGHTPGHTVLLVRLANAGPVLLTGDMYHLAETREQRLVPTFNVDRTQTLASMDKVEELASETGARVIRQHVPEDFESLPRFPEALN
jgi:N-acyl homoserine lactone hydrolase